jgi:hypothetical protein
LGGRPGEKLHGIEYRGILGYFHVENFLIVSGGIAIGSVLAILAKFEPDEVLCIGKASDRRVPDWRAASMAIGSGGGVRTSTIRREVAPGRRDSLGMIHTNPLCVTGAGF